MNITNDGAEVPGRVLVLGKVGRGRGAFIKRIVAERQGRLPVVDLDALLSTARRLPLQRPDHLRGMVDPERLWQSPAQLIMGSPQGDREFRRRMMYLWGAEEGVRLIELTRRDSRFAGERDDLELTAGESFTLDSSRLSCSPNEAEI